METVLLKITNQLILIKGIVNFCLTSFQLGKYMGKVIYYLWMIDYNEYFDVNLENQKH